MNQSNQPPAGSAKKSGSNTALIIIIIVVVLAALGVGGYFGWKYVSGKYFKTSSGTATPKPSATASSTTMSSTKTTISAAYIISDSNTRLIAESELTELSAWELKVARNEIYARHGRPFVHKDLQCYFATKTWYKVDESFTEAVLSTIETKNIATIQTYEQKIGSPLQSKDSGC